MQTSIRPYRPDDLGPLVRLWEESGDGPAPGEVLTVDQAVELVHAPSTVTLVAEVDGEGVVGVGFGSVADDVGWVHEVTVRPDAADDGVAAALLDELEGALADHGARRLAALVADGGGRDHLARRGYQPSSSLVCLERAAPEPPPRPAELTDVGGRMVEPGLWDRLQGMDEIKAVIERRVILPLAEPDLAARHAVTPPKAIVLFGPPGTGKTTFVKAIASHLDWAFVEIQPGELAGEGPALQAQRLARTFDAILRLDSAVVFVDEVEDLASVRGDDRKVRPSVTNEFLKQIPRVREAAHHLLVCATNLVGHLDPAFLRHGRFDYVIPIGPPGPEARAATWRSHVDAIADDEVDVAALVGATDNFTQADIEFAARQAAHAAFEREHFEGRRQPATTEDFLAAIRATRRTLTDDMVRAFAEDTRNFARY